MLAEISLEEALVFLIVAVGVVIVLGFLLDRIGPRR